MESQLTVLHVDDDPSFLRLTGRRFERSGDRIRVISATTADEAFDLIGGGRFDCVVSDSMLTRDGESFVAAVRRRHPELPVVLFTGADWDQVAEDAREAEVAAYVQKGTDDPLSTLQASLDSIAAKAERDTDSDLTLPPILGDGWQVVATHDWSSSKELVVTVVDAVNSIVGPDGGASPLYDAVNGEAMEELLRRRDGRRNTTVVRFIYRGLDIAVTGEGHVAIRQSRGEGVDPEAETSPQS